MAKKPTNTNAATPLLGMDGGMASGVLGLGSGESKTLDAVPHPPSSQTPDAIPNPPPAPPSAAPAILEYQPVGSSDRWRVERYADFCIEFNVTSDHARHMALFQDSAQVYVRGWLICRRLFGIAPVIPPADANPDDLRTYTRRELCEALGLENSELSAELAAVRGMTMTVTAESASAPVVAAPSETLAFSSNVLEKHGFEDGMFTIAIWNPVLKVEEMRSSAANRLERDWFAKRVAEWDKMLDEPMAHALTREALMNELYLRRLQAEMAVLSPGSGRFKDLHSTKKNLETTYQEQLEKLQTMFPESSIAGKISFRAVLSDFSKGYREYSSNGSTALIDRVRTAAEIDVELRQSLQSPEVRYRAGQTIYIIEAQHNLYNPNFRSQLSHRALRVMDVAFKEAADRLRQDRGEPLPDLEKGVAPGEGDDYPEIGA